MYVQTKISTKVTLQIIDNTLQESHILLCILKAWNNVKIK
jgi:hypothetical protein